MGLKYFGYYFFKYWVSIGLFFYYRSINIVGVERVPKEGPVLFLSNHQNALLDILLIATNCKRKPWFLTRADVFKNTFFRPLFSFLQMLPVYRMRDGKDNLSKNQLLFTTCAGLLRKGESILVFPEANHSLNRRVRPLSKGFTRIIEAALQADPQMQLNIVPIGQNYQMPTQPGDEAALYFGEPIPITYVQGESLNGMAIKQEVFEALKKLTTHIEEEHYQEQLSALHRLGIDFTDPVGVNTKIKEKAFASIEKSTQRGQLSARSLFFVWNFPIVLLWRTVLKNRVPEPEFMATFRFGFALLVYPLVYLLVFFILSSLYDMQTACLLVVGHAAFNLVLVKMVGITSYHQRI